MDNLQSNLRALLSDMKETDKQFHSLLEEVEAKQVSRGDALIRFSQRLNYMQFLIRKMRAFVQKELLQAH